MGKEWAAGCQGGGQVARRGAHRKRREHALLPGLLIHRDGSRHEWVAGRHWNLIVTMDDATGEHYSMFFVKEEGTASSSRGVHEVIERHGLFACLASDNYLDRRGGGALVHRARALAAARCRPSGDLRRASRTLQGENPDAARTAHDRRHRPAETPIPGDFS